MGNSRFQTSDETNNAYDKLKRPEDVDPAYWEAVDAARVAYQNRGKFSFDLNGDALYQQYKDKYIQQGKMAMQDTMGQAAAMTGGYGNSYAATAGNQAYQAHLENLNDVVPELYQMAYDKYNQEGQDLLTAYQMAMGEYDAKHGEYMDDMSIYNADRQYLYGSNPPGGTDDPDEPKEEDEDVPTFDVDPNSAAIKSFLSSLPPESTHDAIARKMYGPYGAYVALKIYQDANLSYDEKEYLMWLKGITDSDVQYLKDKGWDVE